MFRLIPIAAMLLAAPAAAQEQADADTPPERIRSVVLYGDDKCPEAQGDEIVVCAHAGESPYRLPERFRDSSPDVGHQSWVARNEFIDRVNRAGLPNSCSPVGDGGQTGCNSILLRRAAEAKAAKEKADSDIP